MTMRLLFFVSVCTAYTTFGGASAQSTEDTDIVVTGSRLSASDEYILPIRKIGRGDYARLGATGLKDIAQFLTINTGAENNPDAFTQSATSGTSNFNLRGIGVGSTLVLLNGRRTTQSAATTNAGVSFVDVNGLIPDIALSSVEILTEGAGAIYGSDAIAGVVNVRSRDDLDGGEVYVDYQSLLGDGASDETRVQVAWGGEWQGGTVLLAAGYTSLSELTTEERRLSPFGRDDVSSLGNPASFVVYPVDVASISTPTFVIDPTGCSEFGGIPFAFGQDTGLGQSGLCRFDFGQFFSLVPEMQKAELFAQWTGELAGVEAFLEVSGADISTVRGNSPSFPVLTQPIVSADHLDNPFGIDVGYFGRILGNGSPRFDTPHESTTWRIATGLAGALSVWEWDASIVMAQNDHRQEIRDTVRGNLERALQGFGGENCVGVLAGADGCEYFNPFATSFTTAQNSAALIDWLQAEQVRDGKATATIADFTAQRRLGELDGGSASIAVGAQWRQDKLDIDYDDVSNADGFAFLIGNPDTAGNIGATAAFAELSLPILSNVSVQAAVRYETYTDDIGDSLDPKLAVGWTVTPSLRLRASYATSFRAPSVFQTSGASTILNQARDPITGTSSFVANRTTGGGNLNPEAAENIGFGAQWTPTPSWRLSADYWSIAIDDLIVQENFQSVLDAFPQDPSRVVRAGDPASGPVVQINTERLNATEMELAGIDMTAVFANRFSDVDITGVVDASWVTTYDIADPQRGRINGVGQRNFTNIGTSMPEFRADVRLGAGLARNELSVGYRFIDAYKDDQNSDREIDAWHSIDVQYTRDLSADGRRQGPRQLILGVSNIGATDAPEVRTNGGYDSKVHDPRGAVAFMRVSAGF